MMYANTGTGPRTTPTIPELLPPGPIWFDLVDPTEEERAAVAHATGLRIPSRDEVSEIESSSRVGMEGEALYLNTSVTYRSEDGRSATTPLGFVLAADRLVTVRFAELPVLERFAAGFPQHKKPGSTAEIFVGLIEAIVDRMADVMEWVAAELNKLSQRVFRGEQPGQKHHSAVRADRELRETLTQVGRLGDVVGNLRDALLGLGRIVAYAGHESGAWFPEAARSRCATLKTDISSLNDYDQQLTAKVGFLLDATLGFINIEQNNGVKVLTIVSVVGIPPTFIVGLYGMNFKNMPEYDWSWGYQYAWVLILVSIVAPLVWFKVKGWF